MLDKLSVGCWADTNETIKNNFDFCILNESHRVDCANYLSKGHRVFPILTSFRTRPNGVKVVLFLGASKFNLIFEECL